MSNIVGIDLGTTFSALSILNAIGKPEIIPNADGERLTPSAIFFDEENTDIVRVGVEAIHSRHLNAQRSVRWIKRHMGESGYSKSIDDKTYSPVELSSLILKKLRTECAANRGDIKEAVISVPAHFDEVRRKATMDAGKLAGLNVIGIVNEPVAAALYYASTTNVYGKILVYDLGGGTFDVTVMDVRGHQIDIICSQGDHFLGGIDFDNKIVEILEKEYEKKFKSPLIDSEEDRARYQDEAEDIKKTLSRREVAKKVLYGSKGSMKVNITRQMFQEAISSLLDRTDMLLAVALEEASLKPNELDKVLLVGGSTRIPIVRKKLEEIFAFPPENTPNVDECVAMGAAIHAGLTMVRDNPEKVPAGISGGLSDIKLTDVCNHSYGTICAPLDRETGKRVVQNRIILRKNTPLPCQASQTFYTVSEGQNHVEINITQGEDSDPEYVNPIATHRFELPPDRPAECPIKVTYKYDINQRMHCSFHDLQSGRKLEIEFCLDKDGGITDSEIKKKSEKFGKIKVE